MRIRFFGDESTVTALAPSLDPSSVEVESDVREVTGSTLDLDLSTVADLIAIMSVPYLLSNVAGTVRAVLNRDRKAVLKVESPLGSAMFESQQDLTEDEIRRRLQKLVDVG